MTRAERRANAERAKARAKRQLKVMWRFGLCPLNERAVGLHAATPKLCSCYLCGNPRRYFGEITLREQKRNERELAEMEEWPWLGE